MAVIAKSFMTNESLQMRDESLGETPVLLYGATPGAAKWIARCDSI